MTILDRLPRELQIEVYKHLDGFSLKSLMWAFPDRVADFIVVSDRSQEKELVPVFFKIPGIKITRLAEYGSMYLERQRRLFTLYEITDIDYKYCYFFRLYRRRPPVPYVPYLKYDMPNIGYGSFIYVRALFFGGCAGRTIEKFTQVAGARSRFMVDYMARDLVSITNWECNRQIECGFPYWPTATPQTVDSFYESCGVRLSMLTSLEIHSVSTVSNLYFRKLKRLVVHFGSSDSYGPGTYPSITSVTVRDLQTFIVYYEDQFPVIRDFCPCTVRHIWPYEVLTEALFHAVHKPSMTTHCCSTTPVCKLPELEDDVDLSFTKSFRSIHITGGPDGLLEKLDLKICKVLYWKQTGTGSDEHIQQLDQCFDLGAVREFTFETTLPNPIVPKLRFDIGPTSIAILWYCPTIDFNGLWENTDWSNLRELGLWCYDGTSHHSKSTSTHTAIPLATLSEIVESAVKLQEVVLRGVELQRNTRGDVVAREAIDLDIGRMKGKFGDADNSAAARRPDPPHRARLNSW